MPKDQGSDCNIYIYIHVKWRIIQITLPEVAALAQGALVSSVSNVSKEVEGTVENKKISHGMPKDQESECNMCIYIYIYIKWRKIQITLPEVAALAFICSVVKVEGAVEITKVVSLVTNKLIDLARSQVQRNNKITNNKKDRQVTHPRWNRPRQWERPTNLQDKMDRYKIINRRSGENMIWKM